MDFVFKINPRPGMCPVRGCRKRKGPKKALCDMHHYRRWAFRNPVLAAYIRLKSHAKQRKKVFSITLEEFKDFTAKHNYIEESGRERQCLHIDRIDSEGGYTVDNIQVLECSLNSAKDNRKQYVGYYQEFNECPF